MGKLNNTTRYPLKTPVDADQIYGYSAAAAGPGSQFTFSSLLTWLRSKLAAAPVTVAEGGTGATNAAAALTALGGQPKSAALAAYSGSAIAYDAAQSSGLSAYFTAGKVFAADGAAFSFAGGAVTLRASATNYVMLDLFTAELHSFRRAIHGGAILIATVVTAASSITSVIQPQSFSVPPSRVERFKRRLALGLPCRVLVVGDSLSAGAGSSPFTAAWQFLLLATNGDSATYRLPNVGNIARGDATVGGADAPFGMTWLANIVGASGWGGNNRDIGIQALPVRAPTVEYRQNAYAGRTPDLVIIGWGANPATNELAFLETQVREWILRGSEVVLHTENDRSDLATPNLDEGENYRAIAEVHGCALVDTWAYVQEKTDNGVNLYSDTVHMNNAGHLVWANAMRSVLNDLKQVEAASPVGPIRRIHLPTSGTDFSNLQKIFPNASQLQFVANATTGAYVAGATTTLGVVLGGISQASSILELETGETADFASLAPLGFDIIVENGSGVNASVEVRTDAGVLKTVNVTGNGNPMQRVQLLTYAEILALATGFVSYSFPQIRPLSIRLQVASGTLRLAAVLTHTLKIRPIPWSDLLTTDGSSVPALWPTEPAYAGSGRWLYTDTLSALAEFEFEGNGLMAVLHRGTAAGQVSVTIGGEGLQTNRDLYTAGSVIDARTFWPRNNSLTWEAGAMYGRHGCRLALGAALNGSAVSAGAQNRRLAIYSLLAIDAR
jgi:lysophospholipase L1-like esterase